MKLTNLLVIVGIAGTCLLLGSTSLPAQTFQPGDFVVGGSQWYHADGTYVKTLGAPCTGCFAGVFDLQGAFWQLSIDLSQGIVYVSKYDLSGNLVSYFAATGPFRAQGIFLDAKGNIYIVGTGNQGAVYKYDASGNFLTWWPTHDLGGNPSAWPQKGDLTRDQKKVYLDGVFTLTLSSSAIKGLACGANTVPVSQIRILPDGTYLANNSSNGATAEVDHCTATGKLIRAYSIPLLGGGSTFMSLTGLAFEPDLQSFMVGNYDDNGVVVGVQSVDFSTGNVTTILEFDAGSFVGYSSDIAIFGTVGIANCPLSAPATVTFPSQIVNTTSPPHTVTVKNIGTSPVPIGSVTITGKNAGDFAETDNCSNTTLGVGKKCSVNVTFTPGAIGKRSAALDVANSPGSAICSPLPTNLKGTGTS